MMSQARSKGNDVPYRKEIDDPFLMVAQRISDRDHQRQLDRKEEANKAQNTNSGAAGEVRIQPVAEAKPRKNTPERAKQLATEHIATQSSNRVSGVPAPTVTRPTITTKKEENLVSRPPERNEKRAIGKGHGDPMERFYQRLADREENKRGTEYEKNFTSHYQR